MNGHAAEVFVAACPLVCIWKSAPAETPEVAHQARRKHLSMEHTHSDLVDYIAERSEPPVPYTRSPEPTRP